MKLSSEILKIGCCTLYHCLYLQCKDTLNEQNDGVRTVIGLCYYKSTEENTGPGRGIGEIEGEIPEPVELIHEKIKITYTYMCVLKTTVLEELSYFNIETPLA